MSIPFPQKHGGMGLGVFEAVLAIEEVARADQSLAVSAMVSMATGLHSVALRQRIADREVVAGDRDRPEDVRDRGNRTERRK